MKIDFIVISVLLVTLVILPFVLLPLIQNGGSKKLQKKFREEASRLNLNIDIKESWNQNIFGIDSVQRKMIFVNSSEEIVQIHTIDLNRVKQSSVAVTTTPANKGGKKEEHLQRIDLEFLLSSPEEKKILSLYHYDINFTQDLELKNAEKCNSQIQNILITQPYFKRTA